MSTEAEELWARVNALAKERDAAVAALASARAELEQAEANIDALISYPCAVAFDASRAGWSVAPSTGVDFVLNEAMASTIDRARAVAMEEAARWHDAAAVESDKAATFYETGAQFVQQHIVAQEWADRAAYHRADATTLRALAPLDPALVVVEKVTIAKVREALEIARRGIAGALDAVEEHEAYPGSPEQSAVVSGFRAIDAALKALETP